MCNSIQTISFIAVLVLSSYRVGERIQGFIQRCCKLLEEKIPNGPAVVHAAGQFAWHDIKQIAGGQSCHLQTQGRVSKNRKTTSCAQATDNKATFKKWVWGEAFCHRFIEALLRNRRSQRCWRCRAVQRHFQRTLDPEVVDYGEKESIVSTVTVFTGLHF